MSWYYIASRHWQFAMVYLLFIFMFHFHRSRLIVMFDLFLYLFFISRSSCVISLLFSCCQYCITIPACSIHFCVYPVCNIYSLEKWFEFVSCISFVILQLILLLKTTTKPFPFLYLVLWKFIFLHVFSSHDRWL